MVSMSSTSTSSVTRPMSAAGGGQYGDRHYEPVATVQRGAGSMRRPSSVSVTLPPSRLISVASASSRLVSCPRRCAIPKHRRARRPGPLGPRWSRSSSMSCRSILMGIVGPGRPPSADRRKRYLTTHVAQHVGDLGTRLGWSRQTQYGTDGPTGGSAAAKTLRHWTNRVR